MRAHPSPAVSRRPRPRTASAPPPHPCRRECTPAKGGNIIVLSLGRFVVCIYLTLLPLTPCPGQCSICTEASSPATVAKKPLKRSQGRKWVRLFKGSKSGFEIFFKKNLPSILWDDIVCVQFITDDENSELLQPLWPGRHRYGHRLNPHRLAQADLKKSWMCLLKIHFCRKDCLLLLTCHHLGPESLDVSAQVEGSPSAALPAALSGHSVEDCRQGLSKARFGSPGHLNF